MMRWLSRLSPRERAIVVGGTAILAVVLLWLRRVDAEQFSRLKPPLAVLVLGA